MGRLRDRSAKAMLRLAAVRAAKRSCPYRVRLSGHQPWQIDTCRSQGHTDCGLHGL